MKYFTAVITLSILLTLFFLTGCITPVQRPPTLAETTITGAATRSASYQGRFAVHYDNAEGQINGVHKMRSAYGHFKWCENGGDDTVTLQLFDPLGQTLAIIESSPLGAMLELPDRRRQTAANVEDLMQNTLGFALPIHSLQNWLQSSLIATADGKVNAVPGFRRPLQMKRDGWTIKEVIPAVGSATRMRRIDLTRDEPLIQVKLIIDL